MAPHEFNVVLRTTMDEFNVIPRAYRRGIHKHLTLHNTRIILTTFIKHHQSSPCKTLLFRVIRIVTFVPSITTVAPDTRKTTYQCSCRCVKNQRQILQLLSRNKLWVICITDHHYIIMQSQSPLLSIFRAWYLYLEYYLYLACYLYLAWWMLSIFSIPLQCWIMLSGLILLLWWLRLAFTIKSSSSANPLDQNESEQLFHFNRLCWSRWVRA